MSSVLKLGYRPADVIECFGSAELYEEARASGMLEPRIVRRRLVLFNAADVHACWGKMMGGELPPPRKRERPRKALRDLGAASVNGKDAKP